MVAAVICDACRPDPFIGGEPMHHPGQTRGQTTLGLLGGWTCACPCVSSPDASRDTDPPTNPSIGADS